MGKGRDSMWIGAIDGPRINYTIYDFEPTGSGRVQPADARDAQPCYGTPGKAKTP